jgi:DUF4097 and DUF4098 domain-containing protein YvlB
MKYIAVFVALMIPIIACAAMTATESRTLEISAEGIEKTIIECGAGFLKVNGEAGLTSITVDAEIEVENLSEDDLQEFIDKNITLTLEKKGPKAVLKSEVKELLGIFRKTIKNVRINLTVRIPREMHLKISDGSGSIDVANLLGDMKIDDGSGSIGIEEADGNVEINDGSGSISASHVGGTLDIDDGSGSIDLQHVGGSMKINDGSGSIASQDINGDVSINDGSGSIAAQDINGDVSINDGSGEIDLKTVNGNVSINDGSGGIELRLITGNVSLTDGSGGIYIDGVEQDVNILAAGSGSVVTKNVKGNVSQLD